MDKNRFKNILKKFSKQKVMVIGDMVADEYILGMTSRVSREAPVLILKYDSQTVLPGCGANAVNNIHSLGGTVFPVGIVVMKSGTATVTIEEIKNAIESETLALITNT